MKNNDYRILQKGEVILATDEYYNDDKKQWVPVQPFTPGKQAPDPRYTAHRVFRRKVEENAI